MWSILFINLSVPYLYKFIHLRVVYTIVVEFNTFEGSFTHLYVAIHLRVEQCLHYTMIVRNQHGLVVNLTVTKLEARHPDNEWISADGRRVSANVERLLLSNSRICIPLELRAEVFYKLRSGNNGVVKTTGTCKSISVGIRYKQRDQGYC